ncbi:MAG: heparinase II/III family protein, partial [Pyrinomonadaceae bacterium]
MLAKLWPTIKNHGWGWTSARLAYELQVRSGLHALRFNQRPWAEDELAAWLSPGISSVPEVYQVYWRKNKPQFFFNSERRPDYEFALGRILGEQGRKTLVEQADRLRRGYLTYFFSQSAQVGLPPDWHSNPFTGQRTSPVDHWSRIPIFSPQGGDLKFIWESGRFACAYSLARAYWGTGDDVYAETFWQLVESWGNCNAPNHGAHWKCGQDISLRLMAWCFALHAFADSTATTAQRLALMAGMIAVQADRVAGDPTYAKLQANNHSITEGTGLWTVGLLFPEFERSAQWRSAGREILEREALSQIATDGSYIQNSMNYHRLMLQDYIWSIRLGEVCSNSLQQSTLS